MQLQPGQVSAWAVGVSYIVVTIVVVLLSVGRAAANRCPALSP
jgi:hypothetical protein